MLLKKCIVENKDLGSCYEMRIRCDGETKTKLEEILGSSSDESERGWSLTINEDSSKYNDALNIFIDLVAKNLSNLTEIGVPVDMITFWYLYAYEQQCNMEFWPGITKKIGDLGIVLCISCWEK